MAEPSVTPSETAPWEMDALATSDAAPETSGPWENDARVNPTVAVRTGAFSQQAVGSAATYGGATAGATMGVKIGTAAAPFLGPAAPAAPFIGGLTGLVAGYYFGTGVKDILGVPEIKDVPEEVRPYAVAGDTFGAGFSISGAPVAAARAGVRVGGSKVADYMDRLIQRAASNPGAFARVEMAGVSGSAWGGGVAESYDPGALGTRLGAEVLGGIASPFRIAGYATHAAWDRVKRALSTMGEQGRKTEAGRILHAIVEAVGEDPDMLAAALRASGLPGTNLTSAQKTGSPALAAFEAALISENSKFGEEAARRAADGLDAIKSMILVLVQTGDPAALKEAGRLRSNYFRVLISSGIQDAEESAVAAIQAVEKQAIDAAGKITRDLPKARSALSAQAEGALEASLESTRTVERSLWEAIPKDVPADAKVFLETFAELKATMLPEQVIPGIVEKTVARLTEGGAKATSGELVLLRKEFLALARDAAKGTWEGHLNAARIYGVLAEAVLGDLDKMATAPAFGAYGKTAAGYDAARQFSRELNDVYTRTFAGDATALTRSGADKIPPELLLRVALGTGAEQGALRFKQLEEAAGFIPKMLGGAKGAAVKDVLGEEGAKKASENFQAVMDAQERFFRLMASAAVDPNTGRVSPTRLAIVMRDNGELLEKFPDAAKTMKAALDAELSARHVATSAKRGASDVVNIYKNAQSVIEQKTVFSKLMGVDAPVDALHKVVKGPNPLSDIHALVKLAQRGGPEATEGLKATMWEYLIRASRGSSGEIDLTKMAKALDMPLREGLPSLAQVMERNGLMTTKELKQVRSLFGEVQKIVVALETKTAAEISRFSPPQLVEIAVRIAGAQVGRVIAGATGGGTVQTPGIVSAQARGMFQKLFDRIPNKYMGDMLLKVAKEPEFAAMLLENPVTEVAKFKLARQMHAYLYTSGLMAAEDAVSNEAP